MGLYLYCIAGDAARPAPDLTGVGDAAVRAIAVQPFTLWVSELDASPAPEVETVRSHHAVVEAAVDGGRAVLPVRFGQWLASRDRLERRITRRRDDYRAALQRVAGSLEFALRLVDPEDPESAATDAGPPRSAGDTTGTEYMEALARRLAAGRSRNARAQHGASELRAAVDGLIRDERLEMTPSSRTLVKVAHLVSYEHLERYRANLKTFEGGARGERLLISGPWPPYSFAA